MKYAFIFGTNAFIVPHGTVNLRINNDIVPFLKIKSLYKDGVEGSGLVIDADFNYTDGKRIVISDNYTHDSDGLTVKSAYNIVQVLKADGDIVFDVHQLDEEATKGLEHYMVAEMEVNAPVAAIRIRGDFMLGDLEIRAENEKLFIGDDSYGTSAMTGHGDLVFTTDGVVL